MLSSDETKNAEVGVNIAETDWDKTPAELGYRFPPEWSAHAATLTGWPFDDVYWEGQLEVARNDFETLVSAVARFEPVRLAVADDEARADAERRFSLQNVEIYGLELDDVWFRDIAPLFVKNAQGELAATDWLFNGWGNKYRWLKDTRVPAKLAKDMSIKRFEIPVVMEGGALDINGAGECLTTRQCLLNPNRNPDLSKSELEQYLQAYLGVTKIIWLGGGLEGDKTDGHVDTITRWANDRTVVTSVCEDESDSNYAPLAENSAILKRLEKYEVLELPLPKKRMDLDGERLPLTYANFYVGNGFVVVPTYQDANDERALDILRGAFPTREVIGLNATGLITGGGAFHCVTQQVPKGTKHG